MKETLLERCQRDARHTLLHTLEVDYKEYTPDQGMPPIVYELNDAQLDYLIAHTLKEASKEIGRLKDIFNGVELGDNDKSYLSALTDAQNILTGGDSKAE
jgi:hypothetical protein